ncbi:MAG TPA: G1 family glutamic endopeptidase [Acidimicrobiales bacterium]
MRVEGPGGARRRARRAIAIAGPCGLLVACVLFVALPAPVGAVGRPGSASVPAAVQAGNDPRNIGPSPVSSLDWSGYAVTGPTFSSVAGSWVQPAVTCPGKKVQLSAFWIGIDGFAANDQTVEQIGTDSDCTKGAKKVPGGPVYYAWYELFPAALVVLPPATYPVAPGDSLSASVHVSGAAYALVLTDVGHWTFSTTVTTPTVVKNASAEWIAEAPTVCAGAKCKPLPLADFGSVGFTGASANGEALTAADLTSSAITMAAKKGTLIEARPGPLVGGSAFAITWLAL